MHIGACWLDDCDQHRSRHLQFSQQQQKQLAQTAAFVAAVVGATGSSSSNGDERMQPVSTQQA
jgi:hypothetical protein